MVLLARVHCPSVNEQYRHVHPVQQDLDGFFLEEGDAGRY
jgi:hypothetical protein